MGPLRELPFHPQRTTNDADWSNHNPHASDCPIGRGLREQQVSNRYPQRLIVVSAPVALSPVARLSTSCRLSEEPTEHVGASINHYWSASTQSLGRRARGCVGRSEPSGELWEPGRRLRFATAQHLRSSDQPVAVELVEIHHHGGASRRPAGNSQSGVVSRNVNAGDRLGQDRLPRNAVRCAQPRRRAG